MQQLEFIGQRLKPVLQLPKGLASFCTCEHILLASFGYGLFQKGEDADKLCGRLSIEVVHADGGCDSLWVVVASLTYLVEVQKDAHTVIIDAGSRLQGRSIALGGLQIGVVLLFPLLYLGELSRHGCLKGCCLSLGKIGRAHV